MSAAKAFLSGLPKPEDDVEVAVLHGETVEFEYGWVFFWNSQDFESTGDYQHMLVGCAPFFVPRDAREEIVVLGTDKPVEEYMSEIRRRKSRPR